MGGFNLRQYFLVITTVLFHRAQALSWLYTAELITRRLTLIYEHLERHLVLVDLPAVVEVRVSALVRQQMESAGALATRLRGIVRDPSEAPDVRAAAERILPLVIDRQGPSHSVGERVQYVDSVRRKRPALEPELALLGPAIPRLLDRWLEEGEAIVAGLRARSEVVEGDTMTAFEIVTEARKAVAALRRAIRVELTLNPDLPADLERQILGFADEVAVNRPRPKPESELEALEEAEAPDDTPRVTQPADPDAPIIVESLGPVTVSVSPVSPDVDAQPDVDEAMTEG